MRKVARALLSVHNKSGVVELARALARHGCEILSTGGTARLLGEEGIPVVQVADHTGSPEILGGRVKTLHPRIAGGILALRDVAAHARDLEANAIPPIDLVAVNLYPFEETTAREGVSVEEAIEEIDIGGPTLLRAAAKNFPYVAVLADPSGYAAVIAELDRSGGALALETRKRLAVRAFEHVARYDARVSRWLRDTLLGEPGFPESLALGASKLQDLRYGENPHQRAAFYRTEAAGLGAAVKRQGKELSYNNLLDLDAALGLARELEGPAAVIVKHTNPCGAAVAGSLHEAYRRARETDPVSAFGGVVALNRPVDAGAASLLVETFLEAVVAPAYLPEALDILAGKKALRLLEAPLDLPPGPVLRSVAGGLLVQEADATGLGDLAELTVATRRAPTEAEMRALRFAWLVAKHVKSNAIVFAADGRTVGIGAGQMSRVDSARIAAEKALLPLAGTVAASDAFFPFRDGLDVIARAGATAVIQPGGSVRDAEVIAAADEHGLAIVLTGVRHFRH